jgi:hypothetical protein
MDQNAWLQCLLGIVSETSRLAGSLTHASAGRTLAPQPIDPFVAALLGVLSLRAEIDAAAHESTERSPVDTTLAHPHVNGRRSRRLPGKPGELMR